VICIDWEKSKAALVSYLEYADFKQLIITGFIASTTDGKRTILGRNGSDFSAAIFANLFDAKLLKGF
jgi:aspartokinase/homoserine dehydrogenase 1